MYKAAVAQVAVGGRKGPATDLAARDFAARSRLIY